MFPTRAVSIPFLILATALLIPVPIAGDCAETGGPVLLCEVMSNGSPEGVSIFNYGDGDVDLVGYSVTDGEGAVTFGSTFILPAGSRVSLVPEMSDSWFCQRGSVCVFGEQGTAVSGSFRLNNSGDEVVLKGYYREVLDVFVYGSSEGSEGWSGDPAPAPKADRCAKRTSSEDTDSAADWEPWNPGMTDLGSTEFDAVVRPFVFPDSEGMPIFAALESATDEICISMYLLTNERIVSLLVEMESRGVDVIVLLEGSPVGVPVTQEMRCMRSLVDAGGEVSIISKYDSQKRFQYLHAKYCVIDRQTVIVTSENWTGSFGNRGWGVVAESEEYAECMRDVFFNDVSTVYGDVRPLMSVYPTYKPAPLDPYVTTGAVLPEGFPASVVPVLSPDNSFEVLEGLIASAEDRVLSEQLDLADAWAGGLGYTPLSWMSAAADRGADCRLLLNASFDPDSVAALVDTVTASTSVLAAAMDGGDGFGTVHNKGVIVDGTAWVGSVNWTQNSFANNRECALAIDSPDVTAFFLEYFERDWSHCYVQSPTEAEVAARIVDDGVVSVFLTLPFACASPSCEWDFDGDGTVDRRNSVEAVAFSMPAGSYSGSVTVTDGATGRVFVGSYGYVVGEPASPDILEGLVWEYGIITSVSLLGAMLSIIRCLKRNTSER